MNKKFILISIASVVTLCALFIKLNNNSFKESISRLNDKSTSQNEGGLTNVQHPLSIEYMRKQSYHGSDLVVEQGLPDGANYHQYIASYKSEGLKIYGLLTVPIGEKPKTGWPVIIFNHGYISPDQYQTTERYVVYVAGFARNSYIVFKPDYRGHGNSEGQPLGAYYSPAYTIDVLNAVSTLRRYKDADPQRIGMWGHSLGGNITLRAIVVSKDIKAAVLWAGVVGTYDELLTKWRRTSPRRPPDSQASRHLSSIRENLQKTYGTPKDNPSFWHSIDPRFYLNDISSSVQLHHGLADESVPWEFSESLKNNLEKEGKAVEYYTYVGADHNISSPNFEIAMQRSVNFFDKYLKGVIVDEK